MRQCQEILTSGSISSPVSSQQISWSLPTFDYGIGGVFTAAFPGNISPPPAEHIICSHDLRCAISFLIEVFTYWPHFPITKSVLSLMHPRARSGTDHRKNKGCAGTDNVLGQTCFIRKDSTEQQKWVAHFYPALHLFKYSFIQSTIRLWSKTFVTAQSLASGLAHLSPVAKFSMGTGRRDSLHGSWMVSASCSRWEQLSIKQ